MNAAPVATGLSRGGAATPAHAAHAVKIALEHANLSRATGSGILTEDEWLLDSPGAAAMVFGGALGLRRAHEGASLPVLSLATPVGFASEWLDDDAIRFGAVAADLFGHGSLTCGKARA